MRYEVGSPRALFTIDDPERRNPLSTEMMDEPAAAVERIRADRPVHGVVGRLVGAEEALRLGIVSRLVAPIRTPPERVALLALGKTSRTGNPP